MSGFVLVLVGNVLRLGSGMAVFVLLARWLGPADFGAFAYWLAIATVATVPLNFGLNTYALREFGARPDERAAVLAAVLCAKLVLAGAVLGLAVLVGGIALSAASWLVFGPLLLAQMAESFSEFYTLAYRAAGAYKAEAAAATWLAGLHLTLVVGAVVLIERSPEVAAAAFALSRLLGVFITRRRAHQVFAAIGLASLASAFAALRRALAYAVEFALSTAYVQLDVLVIELVAGLRAVGLYQAGMKLVQGASRLAPIMALYVLPRITRQMLQGETTLSKQVSAGKTVLLFAGIGALFGGLLSAGAEPIAHHLFGTAYVELPALLPWFGLLLVLRFTETGMGLVLVAAGLQSNKTWLVAVQLLVMLAGGAWAMAESGLRGWLICSVVATSLLLLSYAVLWLRQSLPPIFGART